MEGEKIRQKSTTAVKFVFMGRKDQPVIPKTLYHPEIGWREGGGGGREAGDFAYHEQLKTGRDTKRTHGNLEK